MDECKPLFLGMEHRKNKSKDAATFDAMLAGGRPTRGSRHVIDTHIEPSLLGEPPRHRHAH